MHMADAMISPVVGATMYVASGIMAAYSIRKIRKEEDFKKKIPTMGVMGAFVFAIQMVNFTIPGTGSSGHLCGGLLLSSILGPFAGFLSMIGVLLIQCLFFADGGLLALGANVWNMAFYGCFIGSLIWKLTMKKGMTKGRIILASLVGCILTLQLGAFSVTLETLASGITELPFGTFVATMQPIHLVIGLIEGFITTAVLCFVYEARPEMLWNGIQKTEKQAKFSYKRTIAILACLLVIIGGGMSLLASSNPDGLEWSIEQITGDTEVEERENTAAHEIAESIQSATSFLPDYTFKDSESTIGTSVSGIVGCVITVVFLMVVGYIIKIKRNKGNTVNEQN